MKVQLPNIFTGQGSEGLSVVEVAPETHGRLIELGNAVQALRNARNAEYGVPAPVVSLEAHRQAKGHEATAAAAETYSTTTVEAARQAVVNSLDGRPSAEIQPAADRGQDAKIYQFPSQPQDPEFRPPTSEEIERLRRIADANAAVDQAHLDEQEGA